VFEVTGPTSDDTELEVAKLRIHKQILSEDYEIQALRRSVENLERAEGHLGHSVRLPIPDDVRLAVWARDEGRCVMCSSTADLQFDHIIPVAKGGANTVENIQLLCRRCNLKKSDHIA
jgi:hypothetical protein